MCVYVIGSFHYDPSLARRSEKGKPEVFVIYCNHGERRSQAQATEFASAISSQFQRRAIVLNTRLADKNTWRSVHDAWKYFLMDFAPTG